MIRSELTEDHYEGTYLMFDTEAIDNVDRYEILKENKDMFTTLYGEKSVTDDRLSLIHILKLYDVGIVGNKHIIYGVFLNVTEPKQLEWELEKYRLLLSGKTKDREMEQEKEQSEE